MKGKGQQRTPVIIVAKKWKMGNKKGSKTFVRSCASVMKVICNEWMKASKATQLRSGCNDEIRGRRK